MKATGWKNGNHSRLGTSYGVSVRKADIASQFDREWKSILLNIDGGPNGVSINIDKASFWSGSCPHLIGKEIREWYFETGLAPGPYGKPPSFKLDRLESNHFRLGK